MFLIYIVALMDEINSNTKELVFWMILPGYFGSNDLFGFVAEYLNRILTKLKILTAS
jgi:uncharacterized membrane protein